MKGTRSARVRAAIGWLSKPTRKRHPHAHKHKKNKNCIAQNPKLPSDKISHYTVRLCCEADGAHDLSKRQYAHTFHHKNVICIAKAFNDLPQTWQFAILLHEVGHLLAGPNSSEDGANKAVEKKSGIPIRYKDGPYGEELEWIPARYKPAARKFLFGDADDA
jgi:hypothetical protein